MSGLPDLGIEHTQIWLSYYVAFEKSARRCQLILSSWKLNALGCLFTSVGEHNELGIKLLKASGEKVLKMFI